MPYNCLREIYMRPSELRTWLKWYWLRRRIVTYEKVISVVQTR
ncbi:MAG: hypothetical protein WCV91_02150 [Candidatus Margulisiibacteriota bacterium]